LIDHESEWYADLSKWKQIDQLLEAEKQQQKEIIEAELTDRGLTQPY
jgi:hypothetical protein